MSFIQPTLPHGDTWAAQRLRLGQANVGFWVLLAAAVAAAQPPLPDGPAGWALALVLYVSLQAPFDWIGGRMLPQRHGRPVTPAGAWLRGVAAQAGVFFLTGLLLMQAHTLHPTAAVLLWFALPPALLVGQLGLARAVGLRVRSANHPTWPVARVAEARDPSFVGDWVGRTLILPKRWLALPDAIRRVTLRRRRLAREGWLRGRLAAVAWTWLGLAAILNLPGVGASSPSELLVASAWGTLWAFLGLLWLPRFSREAVFHLDHRTREVVGHNRLVQALRHLDRDQEDESERDEETERVFHPVPSLAARIARLTSGPAPHWPARRVARTALYLGWTQFSWLSRAVHCNAGRPELWVILPGD